MKIKRVYFHYELCEEYNSNMWRQVPIDDRAEYQAKSYDLMLDVDGFEAAMIKAINDWPNSTAQALSASGINHQAWLGHAGCAVNHGSPEDITRLAWRSMTEDQQTEANAAADRAKAYWTEKYMEKLNAETWFRGGRSYRCERTYQMDL